MRVVKFFAIIYFKTNCLNITILIANLYNSLAINSMLLLTIMRIF